MKTYIVIDVESNGPIPGDYSMTSFGAVVVDEKMDKTFRVNVKPISDKFHEDRLKYVDSRDAIDPKTAMKNFKAWILENVKGKPVVFSDNNGYDWMFVCWYFWHFLDENPLGHNSQNINSLYKGVMKDMEVNIGVLRSKELTHDALDDAVENAVILQNIIGEAKQN